MSEIGRFAAARDTAGSAPIDRDHLRHMTLGDGSLEREVLALFDRQADLLIERMRAAPPEALRALAHALKGSARGIGAWRVAQAAGELETAVDHAASQDPARRELAAAVAQARAEIALILRHPD